MRGVSHRGVLYRVLPAHFGVVRGPSSTPSKFQKAHTRLLSLYAWGGEGTHAALRGWTHRVLLGTFRLSSARAATALVRQRRRQYRRRPRRLGRRPRPRRPSAVRTRRLPCGSAAQRTRSMAAAGAVEAVTFETASGAPWMWSCTSCAPDGCAITAPSNAGLASTANTPPILVGTVPAALGDLWCIGRITSMCARSRRAFLAAHRRCQCAFVQKPERAKPHRPVARHHHATAHPLIDVRPHRLVLKAARCAREMPA